MRRAVPPVGVAFRPGFDVAGYRAFARESDTEWVIETLPARVPLTVGRANEAILDVSNLTPDPARGELSLELPAGLRLAELLRFDLSASAWLGWDAQFLYAGVRVRDQTVVCNIPRRFSPP